jgi:hypothetical protein
VSKKRLNCLFLLKMLGKSSFPKYTVGGNEMSFATKPYSAEGGCVQTKATPIDLDISSFSR